MNKEDMKNMIKINLNLRTEEHDLTIADMILNVCDYCNLDPQCIPDLLEPMIRKKVKGITDYEAVRGSGFHPEVSSMKDGDGSITWSQSEGNTKASIYGLSETDKRTLRKHRRLNGYV